MTHMHDRFERFFTIKALLAANIVVILLAQVVGRGQVFYDYGYIHLPVILFMVIIATRIFGRYPLYDRVMKRFLGTVLLALGLLTAAYALEFSASDLGKIMTEAAAYTNVVNFHLMALLALCYGITHICVRYGRRSSTFEWSFAALFVVIYTMTVAIFANNGLVRFEPPVLLVGAAEAIAVCVLFDLIILTRISPVLEDFSKHMIVAVIFLATAAILDALHVQTWWKPMIVRQLSYASHFAFFISMSALFLALGHMSNLGDIYKSLKKEDLANLKKAGFL